jgi:hypothetical protein
VLPQNGYLEQYLQASAPGHSTQLPVIWLYDHPKMLATASRLGLTDDQWGMVKERGFPVGPLVLGRPGGIPCVPARRCHRNRVRALEPSVPCDHALRCPTPPRASKPPQTPEAVPIHLPLPNPGRTRQARIQGTIWINPWRLARIQLSSRRRTSRPPQAITKSPPHRESGAAWRWWCSFSCRSSEYSHWEWARKVYSKPGTSAILSGSLSSEGRSSSYSPRWVEYTTPGRETASQACVKDSASDPGEKIAFASRQTRRERREDFQKDPPRRLLDHGRHSRIPRTNCVAAHRGGPHKVTMGTPGHSSCCRVRDRPLCARERTLLSSP